MKRLKRPGTAHSKRQEQVHFGMEGHLGRLRAYHRDRVKNKFWPLLRRLCLAWFKFSFRFVPHTRCPGQEPWSRQHVFVGNTEAEEERRFALHFEVNSWIQKGFMWSIFPDKFQQQNQLHFQTALQHWCCVTDPTPNAFAWMHIPDCHVRVDK